MVYVKKITVDNYDEFLKMALNQKFTMAQNIVQKDEFIEILKTNLIHFENEEAYEGCQKIIEAINYLKTKNG